MAPRATNRSPRATSAIIPIRPQGTRNANRLNRCFTRGSRILTFPSRTEHGFSWIGSVPYSFIGPELSLE
ncbi:MAG: hypothetical protein NVSMB9_18050 [Isosphaeraceae bacterium]